MTSGTIERMRMNTTADNQMARVDEDGKFSIAAPLDRVRWASVLAGLFTVLATLATLTVLGIAVGFSTFDANQPDNFGIGAGIYGVFSAIVAFLFGGFIAARTGAVAGKGNGILNGAMVWIVTIVIIVNLLGSGIGTLLDTARDTAMTAVTVASDAAAAAAANPELAQGAVNAVEGAAADAAAAANAAAAGTTTDPNAAAAPVDPAAIVEDVQAQIAQVTPEAVEEAVRDASPAAWTALLALGLTALAATLGGMFGTRTHPTDIYTLNLKDQAEDRRDGHDYTATTTANGYATREANGTVASSTPASTTTSGTTSHR